MKTHYDDLKFHQSRRKKKSKMLSHIKVDVILESEIDNCTEKLEVKVKNKRFLGAQKKKICLKIY
jgi:hypothetical protein